MHVIDPDNTANKGAYETFPVGGYFGQGGGPVREHLCVIDEIAELNSEVGNSPLALAVGPELKILVLGEVRVEVVEGLKNFSIGIEGHDGFVYLVLEGLDVRQVECGGIVVLVDQRCLGLVIDRCLLVATPGLRTLKYKTSSKDKANLLFQHLL